MESYTAKTRRTTVTKDSMITYLGCKYSVPHQYIGKTVCLSVTKDMLYIYYSTDLISMHSISNRGKLQRGTLQAATQVFYQK